MVATRAYSLCHGLTLAQPTELSPRSLGTNEHNGFRIHSPPPLTTLIPGACMGKLLMAVDWLWA